MTEVETNTNDDVRVYELGYHIVPTVPADGLEQAVSVIRTNIEKVGGSFIAEATPESMQLAYPMQTSEGGKRTTYTNAYFGWIKFDVLPEKIAELQEELESNKNILRFVLFKTVREDTRANIEETETVLREVETKGKLEKKVDSDLNKSGETVDDAELDRSIDELTGDTDTAASDEEA